MMKRSSGFTLVELITIVMILGILAVVAIPRMNSAEYRTQEFRDKAVSALRYAQKSAVSHRRMVCVTFTATTVTLAMDTANAGAACATPLLLPGSNSAVLNSPDASKAYFTSGDLSALNFQPDGTSGGRVLVVNEQAQITVVGATGHVN